MDIRKRLETDLKEVVGRLRQMGGSAALEELLGPGASPSRSRPAPTTNRQPSRDCITGPGAIPAPFFCRRYTIANRGAPRLRRGAPNVGGLGAISGPPCSMVPIFR